MTDSRMRIEAIELGNEREPLAVVDNFFPAADHLASVAKERPFTVANSFYPGLRSAAPNQYLAAIHQLLQNYLWEIFGFEKDAIESIDSAFSVISRRPEELSTLQRIPHFDTPQREGLACVHYLFPETSGYGGTSFYRHKRTGYEYVDAERFPLYKASLEEDLREHGLTEPPRYVLGDTDIFSRYASQEARFNRALFYRASSLHSGDIKPDHSYDPNPETGRLTMTAFIQLRS